MWLTLYPLDSADVTYGFAYNDLITLLGGRSKLSNLSLGRLGVVFNVAGKARIVGIQPIIEFSLLFIHYIDLSLTYYARFLKMEPLIRMRLLRC